jgi:GT2 family glycosyltransferase
MVVVDIIILSYAREVQLKELTQQTIDTLLASENSSKIQFKVIVLESEKSIEPHQYPCSTTIYPKEPFGFHRYLNIGLENTSADYVCFCNNDLIFEKGWATAILDSVEKDSELLCLNPYCPGFHEERFPEISSDITYGYTNGIHFTGWCFFTKRILVL